MDSSDINYVLGDPSILRAARQEAIPSLHQSNLNPTRYGRLRIALPPRDEQVEITRHLENTSADIQNPIDRANREISLLLEYRIRLTADVVTGKLDVRAAVANLPEEADEVEATNDTDALAENEDDTTEADLDAVPEEAEA